ncbi:Ig-like domain-containing protein [Sodaliphilus sp.]|uniref:Ig-like domain-containing protein n=1 Tax=Sodaliphilus sp. TaxID=2815818 RepID=UPI00388FB49B
MKKGLLILALICVWCAHAVNAQLVNGDINDDGKLDVVDINSMVSTTLGLQQIRYIPMSDDPNIVDNSHVAGTWWLNKKESFKLNPDGSTDYQGASTYEFYPYPSRLIFYNKKGDVLAWMTVIMLMDEHLWAVEKGNGDVKVYYSTPTQLVESVKINDRNVNMKYGTTQQIKVTVLPDDADTKTLKWWSSDDAVATVSSDGLVTAVDAGTVTIYCSTTDGSNITDSCSVSVGNKDRSGKDSNGREWVDLDLPSGAMWASWNIGANEPQGIGLFFAWGDVEGHASNDGHEFSYNTYKWANPSGGGKYTKYNNYPEGELHPLDSEDDAATANWGSEWRMPTVEEIRELLSDKNTKTERIVVDKMPCMKVTSVRNGNSILLPYAGVKIDKSYYAQHIYYWTNTTQGIEHYNTGCVYLYDLYDDPNIYGDKIYIELTDERYIGATVRAVRVTSK